jgi:serine/threonine protein kinase
VIGVAGSGTAAWMPKRPDQAPASVSGPRFARPVGPLDRGARSTLGGAAGGRATRPFRFGSEDRPDPDPPLGAGALVGERYRIVRLLGEGGMGRVYEAEHTVLQRRVALKLLRRDAQEHAENLARFQQEALAASRIGTPQIVEVVDFASHTGPAGTQTYMVMELLAGESLEDWMDGPARLDVAVELLAQLCDGLAAAHRVGVIHRDIKPANVFCQAPDPTRDDRRPRVKILDFGIAKITAGGQGFQTQKGSLLGTPYYLAPERVMGAQLTAAADVYSVGVILYEMLTGNVPFVADSFMGILARHVHGEPLDPRQAAPDRPIPDAIAALCMRLLAKEPKQRPSAEGLARELRGLLEQQREQLAAVRTGPREGVAGPGENTQVLPEGEPQEVGSTAISERPTAPPAMDSFAGAASPERAWVEAGSEASQRGAAEDGRGRSSTAIGHGSAAAFAESSRVLVPQVEPVRAEVEAEPGPKRRRGAIALVTLLGLGLVGVAGYALRGGFGAESEGAEAEAEVEAGPTRDVEPVVAEEPPPSKPGPLAEPVPAAADADAGAGEEPSPSEAVEAEGANEEIPDPPREPRDSPKSSKGAKPKPEPQEKPQKEPKDAPVEPDPPADPPPSPPDPAPADTKPDPELPTIKDDVYD